MNLSGVEGNTSGVSRNVIKWMLVRILIREMIYKSVEFCLEIIIYNVFLVTEKLSFKEL